MAYVKNIVDIDRNAFSFLDEIYKDRDFKLAALKILSASKIFYPIEYEGGLAFVPSRFIGYLDNNVEVHIAARARDTEKKRRLREEGKPKPNRGWERDGKDTNPAVEKILGKAVTDRELSDHLSDFCRAFGRDLGKNNHKFWCAERANRSSRHIISAINDIDQDAVGNDDPEYRKRMTGSYVRDAKVREQVLKRANGICEECGQQGFQTKTGQFYLETHHVIALSEQGPDRPHNVIALCATDHRRAHFAENWQELQDRFLAKLSKYKTDN